MYNEGLQAWVAHLRGKTYEQIFGEERAHQMCISRTNSNSPYSRKVKHFCIQCGREIYRGSMHCVPCGRTIQAQKMKGRHLSPEHNSKCHQNQKGNPKPPGTGVKISKAKMGHIVLPETLAKMSIGMTKRWHNPDYVAKQMKSRRVKPNKEELRLSAIIGELSLPYRYVGDGQFILGGKCPDFLNVNGQKKLIEYWGTYWHRNDDPQERIDFFQQYGFATLIIKKEELKALDKVKERLLEFDKQPVA